MFSTIKGFKIQGGFYEKESEMNNVLSRRMNVVFGRNGSGKSSIARAFAELSLPEDQRSYHLQFIGNSTPVPEDKVFVFNEDYIDSKVRLTDSLDAIVMFGHDAELEERIKDASKELDSFKKEFLSEKENCENKNKEKTKAYDALSKVLKSEGGFLHRRILIDYRNKILTKELTNGVIKALDKKITTSIGDLALDVQKRTSELALFKDGEIIETLSIPQFPELDQYDSILHQTVRPAELTSEENHILEILSGQLGSESLLSKTDSLIIETDLDFCPLCHQAVSHDHKKMLADRLLRYKDRTVTIFKGKINDAINSIGLVTLNLDTRVDSEICPSLDALTSAVDQINALIGAYKNLLEIKLVNPYTSIAYEDIEKYQSASLKVIELINKVNSEIESYNQKARNFEKVREGLLSDNEILASRECSKEILEYKARTSECLSIITRLNELTDEIELLESEIQKMKNDIQRIDKALSIINSYLRNIFGKNRLYLDNIGGGKYLVKARGKAVPTKALSVGERNAIALAYFFAMMINERPEDYNYSDPVLLVLDDPVSSFDLENKAGMISLICHQCTKILKGSKQSKVLILTHDFLTLRDVCAVRHTIFKALGVESSQQEVYETQPYFEIETGVVEERNENMIHDNNDYVRRVTQVFEYAEADRPEQLSTSGTIGTSIRRMFEHYASFRFKRPWSDLFSDPLVKLVPEDKRDRIVDLYLRPVLNSESHGTDYLYHDKEIQRVARIAICYLYMVDKPHLSAYLSKKRMDKVSKWVEDL